MTPATAKPMRWDYEYFRADKREKEKILNKIRGILMREDEVTLAIVFGSFTTLESFRDIDIAVYSLDTSLDYIAKLGAKLELGLGIPVDIVPITELDPHSKRNILTKGRIIIEKAPGTYETLLRETEDEVTAIELESRRGVKKLGLENASEHTTAAIVRVRRRALPDRQRAVKT